LGDFAWYRNNSGGHTHEVGQKLPSAWGLRDMHGNVGNGAAMRMIHISTSLAAWTRT
jgi:hypothetical protein